MLRESRKLQHIQQAVTLQKTQFEQTLFAEIKLIHNCLPNLGIDDINLATQFLGKKIDYPLMINAITGGSADVQDYNIKLAYLAKALNIPMAVGSQFAAVKNPAVTETFTKVREIYPNGVIIGNVGAHASISEAKQVVDMIKADALQIHLNPAQELIMSEGERAFCGYLDNIADIAAALDVPVIVKETGCGIAPDELQQIMAVGINYIDISGAGGTNFLAIEAARSHIQLSDELANWGIPTAVNTVLAAQMMTPEKCLIASGGLNTAADIIKALALGADMVAMSMYFLLNILKHKTIDDSVDAFCNEIVRELKLMMLLSGVSTAPQLRNKTLHIKQSLREWLSTYGIDVQKTAQKRRCSL